MMSNQKKLLLALAVLLIIGNGWLYYSNKALMEAQEACFEYGLTTVNDAGLGIKEIELIDSLQQTGDLKMRVYAMVSATKSTSLARFARNIPPAWQQSK